jgi:hypothetical protein
MAEDKDRTELEKPAGKQAEDRPDDASKAPEAPDPNYVRPAGPQEMHMPLRRGWTKTDEEIDESFPASDPPGNY